MTYANAIPDHVDQTEREIIHCLLMVVSKHGVTIAVHDEEEIALARTADLMEVARHVGHTELTTLELFDKVDRRLGTITLVHGNGEDVIADWSWPPDFPEAEAKLGMFAAHALRHRERA